MPEFTSDDYETPQEFVARLEARYGWFDLDACATEENSKTETFYTVEEDGLARSWAGDGKIIFCNPPYSALGKWVAKMASEAERGCTVVGLILASTDTNYWHGCVQGVAAEVLFVHGRISFELGGVPQEQNRYLNAVVLWEPGMTGCATRFGAIRA